VKKFSLVVCLCALFSISAFISCTKINEPTELGGSLIPPIDNITTFDTTIDVETFNEVFGDSTRSSRFEQQFLGTISNDPLFGRTTAAMFLELKPDRYPFTFDTVNGAQQTLFIDSVVLVLGYRGTYGDSNALQKVDVFELASSTSFKADSAYLISSYQPFQPAGLLGSKTFAPKVLDDSLTMLRRERAANQLRIRLDNSFGERLLSYDSVRTSLNGAYASDSAFKSKFKGFAVFSDSNFASSNALMGFSLADTNTKLAIYYRTERANNRKDTSVSYFRFIPGLAGSANYVSRNRSGAEITTYLNNGATTPDPMVYLQNFPGTYARVRVPGLANVSNRLVHRAELIVEQVYDPSDLIFPPPTFIYLDAYDTAAKKYRTIPFDVSFDQTGQLNTQIFGLVGEKTKDPANNPVSVWRLNISRYVQNVVNGTAKLHEFRLSTPYALTTLYSGPEILTTFSINNVYARGRVRVAGGNYPANPARRMRLRIIYSKI
jgi:hypothetical protein